MLLHSNCCFSGMKLTSVGACTGKECEWKNHEQQNGRVKIKTVYLKIMKCQFLLLFSLLYKTLTM